MIITHISSTHVQITLSAGEDISSVAALIPLFGEAAVEIILPGDPPPASASRLTAEEEAICAEAEIALYQRDHDQISLPLVDNSGPQPAALRPFHNGLKHYSNLHRIGPVWVTEGQMQVIEVLRQHYPDGLGTRDIAANLHAEELRLLTDAETHTRVLNQLTTTYSPYVNNAMRNAGMVRKLPRTRLYVASELAMTSTPEVVGAGAKPALRNRKNTHLRRYLTGLINGEFY